MKCLIVITNNTFYAGCADYFGPYDSEEMAEQELMEAQWEKVLEGEFEIARLGKLQSYFWKKKGIRGRAYIKPFSKSIQDYEAERFNQSKKHRAPNS